MTLAYDDVCVIIPTRGDVDLDPIFDALDPTGVTVMVADNSRGEDLAVYARYWGIEQVDKPVILTLDDDVILPAASVDALIAAYQPGFVTANMPERFRPHYPDSCLVGFGAIFDRDLPAQAFERFMGRSLSPLEVGENPRVLLDGRWLADKHFLRTCDVVFTILTPRIVIDVPYADREFASDPDRMWKQPGHVAERARMLDLARKVRDAVPA